MNTIEVAMRASAFGFGLRCWLLGMPALSLGCGPESGEPVAEGTSPSSPVE